MPSEVLLVPLDGSRTARRALPYAAALATMGAPARVVLLTVLPTFEAAAIPIDKETRGTLERTAQRRLRAAARRLRNLGVAEIEIETVWGIQTDDQILDAVKRRHATTIIMGTHGRSGLARALLGSVAMALVQRSPVPCVFVPPGVAIDRAAIREVLVPYDGSELSARSLPLATKLRDAGAHLTVLRVVPPSSTLIPFSSSGMGGYIPVSVMDDMMAAAADSVRAIEKQLGRGVKGEVVLGVPAKAIVDIAHERHADLILMTTHARSSLGRTIMGSVADRVLRTAKTPVLIVPRQSS